MKWLAFLKYLKIFDIIAFIDTDILWTIIYQSSENLGYTWNVSKESILCYWYLIGAYILERFIGFQTLRFCQTLSQLSLLAEILLVSLIRHPHYRKCCFWSIALTKTLRKFLLLGNLCHWQLIVFITRQFRQFRQFPFFNENNSFNTYTKFSEKLTFLPPDEVRNVSFSENLAYVWNEWSLKEIKDNLDMLFSIFTQNSLS